MSKQFTSTVGRADAPIRRAAQDAVSKRSTTQRRSLDSYLGLAVDSIVPAATTRKVQNPVEKPVRSFKEVDDIFSNIPKKKTKTLDDYLGPVGISAGKTGKDNHTHQDKGNNRSMANQANTPNISSSDNTRPKLLWNAKRIMKEIRETKTKKNSDESNPNASLTNLFEHRIYHKSMERNRKEFHKLFTAT